MLILFTGIAPYRGVWSQSRRPGCGTVIFHLLDGCPAIVVPVTKAAPITAWSPWTLSQMRAKAQGDVKGAGGYVAEWQREFFHHFFPSPSPLFLITDCTHADEQICEFLDSIISVAHITPSLQKRYAEVLGRMISLVINGALALERCTPILGKLDPERAGVCFLRY
jgi:hypothetical protein